MNALNPELFAGFLIATTALILMPGPIVSLVIANSVAHGTRIGLATVAGASAGNAALVAAGALGLGAVLTFLADIFDWVRWAGVVYLVYLGLRHWRAAMRGGGNAAAAATRAPRQAFWIGVVIAITNPKTILFYAAFFPQFIDSARAAGPQLAAMSVAFVVIAVTFDGCYALMAGRIGPYLANARRARVRHGIAGSLLIGTGLGLALVRRGG
ncbi:MAG: LysE family translocator [Alphaproteobacteria bacterium]